MSVRFATPLDDSSTSMCVADDNGQKVDLETGNGVCSKDVSPNCVEEHVMDQSEMDFDEISVMDHSEPGPDEMDGADVFAKLNMFTPLVANNHYTVRKMAAQAMMDVALMMANISQLRTLVTAGDMNVNFYEVIFVFVIISIVSQIAFAFLIVILWVRENDAQQREEHLQNIRRKGSQYHAPGARAFRRLSLKIMEEKYAHDLVTSRLNYATMVLVFVITVTNMFITGFGIEANSSLFEPNVSTCV